MSTTIREGNHPWKLKPFAGGITSALKQIAENKKEDGKPCWESRSEESEHVPDGISKLLTQICLIAVRNLIASVEYFHQQGACFQQFAVVSCGNQTLPASSAWVIDGPALLWCQFAKRKTEGFSDVPSQLEASDSQLSQDLLKPVSDANKAAFEAGSIAGCCRG